MKCPYCSDDKSRVIDSRDTADGRAIRRRRECLVCRRRFTTYERVESSLPLIIKKDGSRVPYDRQKVLAGLQKACEKRPVSIHEIERVADEVEAELNDSAERELPSSFIGERVIRALRELDEVAYVRFASVYRQFRDIDEFMDELSAMITERQRTARNDK